jgi:aspartyl/asparaginyl beta-hydroxylase (cupin superfamily)
MEDCFKTSRNPALLTDAKMESGRSPLQRCNHYVPGLRSMPWWRPSELPFTVRLEENFKEIREEFFDLALSGSLRLHPQSEGGPRRAITNGDWNIFELSSRGFLNSRNAVEAPVTTAIIDSFQDLTTHPMGLVYFSVLHPGVHVAPHCGPTNTRIRTHLGLEIPEGAWLRVGNEKAAWKEGRCLVFDDSWEHEASNPSDRMRAVLLLDTWHPDVTSEQRAEMLGQRPAPGGKRHRQRQGWYPKLPSANDGIVSGSSTRVTSTIGAFKALNSPRLESIKATVIRTRQNDALDGYLSAAVEHVSSCLGIQAEAGSDPRRNELATGNVDANESLRRAFQIYVSRGYKIDDFVNITHICSLYWRYNEDNLQSMYDFGDDWSVGEKSALYGRLVRSENPEIMLERLIQFFAESPQQPPFGATAGVLVAALRNIRLQ